MAEHTAGRRVGPGAQIAGVVGEILITLAVILGLFAFWQLEWTSLQVRGPLRQAVAQFQAEHPRAEKTGRHRTDAPPSVGDVATGQVYGVLHVPTWQWMQIPIAQGVEQWILDKGYAGHYPETAQAGQVGNFSLAGHRRTYGNNFRQIDRLRRGDPLIVETSKAYIVYEVESHEIVWPTDVKVVAPVPDEPGEVPTERWMTLTTCHPEYGNTQRYIVHAKFRYWTAKSDGVPDELVGEPGRAQ